MKTGRLSRTGVAAGAALRLGSAQLVHGAKRRLGAAPDEQAHQTQLGDILFKALDQLKGTGLKAAQQAQVAADSCCHAGVLQLDGQAFAVKGAGPVYLAQAGCGKGVWLELCKALVRRTAQLLAQQVNDMGAVERRRGLVMALGQTFTKPHGQDTQVQAQQLRSL